ncbi:hypothetical protein VB834_12165 [Limnoraphis robusta Tam1]|jgi:hypothetical protein|uniref:SxtK n=1 Tax=Limnoraphis robusta CCNP1315 TaxID=3110306 RepID=A0ABU5U5Q7_9CYAN|nr:hypothetical protein [Limnoraphis robusta]MEA5496503.1 hypothetical protein [Limnoraphis robusta BA-68 BA1]MEA5522527.1 hypothetical protein [Limnoraphis robusta CCNP1315]MEA5539786.1 hypothetical protein [Limnoraphis robusta Tam1]MEA5548270.1 hypothetical protein [Limnoraphis robusta CCNP1324]
MLVPDLVYLSMSMLAVSISVITTDEIAKIMARGIALLLVFLSIASAPWLVLLILLVPVLSYKLIERFQW